MQLIGSILFSAMMLINTVLLAVAASFLILLPFHVRAKCIRPYAQFNVWLLKALCGIRYEVIGTENIPKTNYIIFANHQSTWETFALQLIFPPLSFVIKKELLYVPFFGFALAIFKPISIKRGTGRVALKQLISKGIDRLKAGIVVIIFPEGTRIPPDKKVEYKIGGGLLAEKSGYPVLPVAHNAGHYWPKRGFLKKRGVITVHIGKPIETQGRKAKDITQDAEDFIRSHIQPARKNP